MKQRIKPIILAICGKSAVGKDSLARQLINDFNYYNIPAHFLLSDTTRSPRIGEKDGVDYNFISMKDFNKNITDNKYIEYTFFKHWGYGTQKNNISLNKINIGVFNPDGIKNLRKYRPHAIIIPIYLKENCFVRLRRSYYREDKWKIEFFRRLFVDWKAFKNMEIILQFFEYSITLENEHTVFKKSQKIMWVLKKWGIL